MITLIKFKDIFTTYTDFNKLIITPLQTQYPHLEMYKGTNNLTTFSNLYQFFLNQYGERFCRYLVFEFTPYFFNKFADKYPYLYTAQLSFINNEIDDLITRTYRGIIEYNKANGANITTNVINQALAHTNSGTTSNISIDFDKLNDSIYQKEFESNKSDNTITFGKTLTNDIQHLYQDVIEIINGNINFGVEKFLNYFNDLFIRYESSFSSYYIDSGY